MVLWPWLKSGSKEHVLFRLYFWSFHYARRLLRYLGAYSLCRPCCLLRLVHLLLSAVIVKLSSHPTQRNGCNATPLPSLYFWLLRHLPIFCVNCILTLHHVQLLHKQVRWMETRLYTAYLLVLYGKWFIEGTCVCDYGISISIHALSWWHGVAVTRFISATKLLYAGPG